MNKIDPTSKILAQIRAQALVRGQHALRKATVRRNDMETGARKADDWPTQIARKVLAISPDDPLRQRKAFRFYLESILTRELGSQLVNDPGFDDLVEQVFQTMADDPQLAAAIYQAGDFLLRHADPSAPLDSMPLS